MRTRITALRSVACLLVLLAAAIPVAISAAGVPQRVADATTLVLNLVGSSQNVYGSNPTFISWQAPSTARTECSSFLSLLLQHSEGITQAQLKSWTGSSNPNAAMYHDAIQLGKGFTQVWSVEDIRIGDAIAVKYPAGGSSSGHVMLVVSAPVAAEAISPVVDGTAQYQVTVIDSSASGHGPTDTRYISPNNFTGGIGRGVMRLYVYPSGQIAGYTWSTYSNSAYFAQSDRSLVVGRLNQ